MEHGRALRGFFISSLQGIGLELNQEQVDKCLLYLEQLLQWNEITNLTGIEDAREVISKHFIDSLTALQAITFPPGAVLIDVGSGAGFPGLPLKIARQDLQVVLIEPVQKKCSFLASIVGKLKLTGVSVFTGNLAQYVGQVNPLLADIMTVRALRFDEIELDAFHALKNDGKVLLYRAEKFGTVEHLKKFSITSETSFSLPMNYGNRVVTVMIKKEFGPSG